MHEKKYINSTFLGVFGWLQVLIFTPTAPVVPQTFYPWIMAVIVALLGVAQQVCLIGELQFLQILNDKRLNNKVNKPRIHSWLRRLDQYLYNVFFIVQTHKHIAGIQQVKQHKVIKLRHYFDLKVPEKQPLKIFKNSKSLFLLQFQ